MAERNNTLTDLSILATQINTAHDGVKNALVSAVEQAREAGHLLLDAKAKVPHGQWSTWLTRNCTVAERTAQAYMRVSRKLAEIDPAKAQRVAELPLREALAELADTQQDGEQPARTRQEWADQINGHLGNAMQHQENWVSDLTQLRQAYFTGQDNVLLATLVQHSGYTEEQATRILDLLDQPYDPEAWLDFTLNDIETRLAVQP